MGIRLLLWLGMPLLVLLLIFASAIGFLHTDSGRSLVAGQVEKFVSTEDAELDIGTVSGSLFATFAVDSISLSDQAGEWLAIDNLTVTWSPLQMILGRELRISKLAADNISLINLPNSSPSATQSSHDSPAAAQSSPNSLPADILLEEISIGRIQLAEAVVGTDAVISLHGTASVPMQLDNAFAEFGVSRLDGVGGSLRFSGTFDKPGGSLALDLDLDENAGGIVANYLNLQEKPPMRLALSGDGSLQSWSGLVHMDAGNETVIDGTVEIKYEESTVEIGASLDARIDHLVPVEFAEMFKGEISLNLQSSILDDGTVQIDNFAVASDTVNARVAGLVDNHGAPQSLAAHVSATTPLDPLLSQLGLDVLGANSVDAQLDLRKEDQAYQWKLVGDIGDFVWFENSVAKASLAASGEFPLTAQGGARVIPLQADFEFDSSNISISTVQDIVGSTVALSATGFFSTDGRIGVETGVLNNWLGEIDFALGFDNQVLTVDAQTAESKFLQLFDLVDFPVGGQADLTTNVSVDFADDRFTVELASMTNGLELGIGPLDSLLTGNGKITGKGSGNFNLDDFNIAEFHVDTTDLEFAASGDLIDGELDLNVEADIVNLELIAPEITGGMQVSGIVGGEIGSPHLDLEFASETISVIGNQVDNLRADLDLTADIADPTGNLAVAGELKGNLLEGSARLAGRNNDWYEFAEIKVAGADVEIAGRAEVSQQGIIEGAASILSSDIGKVAELVAVDANGALDAKIEFSDNNGRQSVSVAANGTGLTAWDTWVESLEFNGKIADIRDFSSMDGQLTATNLKVMEQVIDSVDGTVRRVDGESKFSVSALAFDSAFSLNGGFAFAPDAIIIDLDRSVINYKSQSLALAEPVRMEYRNGTFATEPAFWQSKFGGLSVRGKSDEKFLFGLDDVSLSAVNIFYPELAMEGLFTGRSELDLSGGEFHIIWNAAIDGASSPLMDGYGLQDFSMLASGEIAGQKMSYNLQVTNEQYVNIDSEGSLELDGSSMSVSLTGKIPMQIVNAIPAINSRGIEMEGILNLDLAASGRLSSPEVDGTISMTDGIANHQEQGIRMDSVELNATVDGQDVNLLKFAGSFADGEMLELTGQVRIDPENSYPLDLRLKGDIPLAAAKLFPRIAERNIDLHGDLNANVSIAGSVLAPDINGQFAISGAELNFADEGIRMSILNLQVEYKNRTLTVVEMAAQLNDSGMLELQGNVEIDDDSTFPSGLLLKGEIPMDVVSQIPALKSQGISFGGNAVVEVTVSGNIQTPDINGKITITDGTFSHAVEDIHFSELEVTATIDNNRVSFESLTAQLSRGGTIAIVGHIDIDWEAAFPASLKVTISEGTIVQEQLLSMTFNSELDIDGPLLTGPKTVGSVDISEMAIQIPERLPGGYSDIEVMHLSASESVVNQYRVVSGRRARDAESRPFNAELDIDITAPASGFLIRGRGVLAEMGGQIKVTGFSQDVAVNGAFTMIRGRLFILGKNLVFERGIVTFTGNFNPELDFLSTTIAPDATITVGVAGVASDPEFTFSSIPELPQDEIMALLLFNRSLDQLSSVQIATLASQIASLTSNLPIGLGTVRSSLGIDVLDLTTDKQGNAAVEVGKYINENIYLGVSRAGETSSVTVDIDITNNLKGRGELDEEGTSKLGLEFNYDY